MKSLDLGCGHTPRNPFNLEEVYGVDIVEFKERNILCADLCIDPIPFPSEMFDCVTAHEFIEHIPRIIYNPNRRNPFIELMNEIHRVLKTGGIFLSFTPAYPYAEAFQDPTHVNIITESTFPDYFCKPNLWGRTYGFTGAFDLARQNWEGKRLLTQMRKVAA